MKTKISILLLLATAFISCKNEKKEDEIDYKFADKPMIFNCPSLEHAKLFNEAFYSFEEDLKNQYLKDDPNQRIERAYGYLVPRHTNDRVKLIPSMVSKHTLNIFEELKKTGIFDPNNTVTHLKHDTAIVECLSFNIANQQIKTTYSALKQTNSLRPSLIASAAIGVGNSAYMDPHLKTYFALAFYYAKLYDVDHSRLPANMENPEDLKKIDLNSLQNTGGAPSAGGSKTNNQ
ncbi:MAG: hypothetical protein HRT68_04870 [Flavobacteriaceae bacterium]|nr:hypothetical protein [Flavobacteriaceae bacterium]